MRRAVAAVRFVALIATALPAIAEPVAAGAAPLKLHVPSPDWREQIVYFVMTDRFADGDARNNSQGAGEYDPTRGDRYNGGDLKGLTQRLDYIRGLGATAVWITPPVRNQWVDPQLGYYGYHGYWAQHFTQVDPHLGTLADMKRLSHELHRRGMYLVNDIVVNHVGNHFDYIGGWDPADPARHYVPNLGARPAGAPTQWPFSLNDPRRPADRRAGVYHWTPALADHTNRAHEFAHQMSNLDDLDTERPLVRRALRASHGWWIREVGVDALRVDTAFYVPPEFFDDFMHAKDPRAPGMVEAARRSGRRDLLVFGEGFGIDRAGEDVLTRRIESYATVPDGPRRGAPRMSGMLNFPLYGALVDVFARGRPPAELADRIERMMRLHARPHWMPSFVDNHDVDRFLAGGSEAALKQALLAMMTLPGIPVLYYGTEQGFTEQRGAMFAAGFASGGRDRYDHDAPLYRLIATMSALRRGERAFTHGVPRLLHASASGPGALAWRMTQAQRGALVVFNTAEHEVLLDNLETGAKPGAVLRAVFGLHGTPADLVADAAGRVTLRLPPRAGLVWTLPATAPTADAGPAATTATTATAGEGRPASAPAGPVILDPLPEAPAEGDFEVRGRAPGARRVLVVVDGDLARATAVAPDPSGAFAARIATGRMTDAAVEHRVVAWVEGGAASVAQTFRVALPWRVLADVADPALDDAGPTGRYRYPTHASFERGQMDLRRVRVLGAGGALRVEVDLGALGRSWAPPNGFDHVAFTLFVELPGRDGGARVMPEQNASLPGGMRWHLRLRAHGWSNALFAPEGASATHDGRPVAPAASIAVDAGLRRVSFTLPAAALGDPASLSGARLYLTTWDYDGGYRALATDGGAFTFGGGSGDDPKVMDDLLVVLP